MTWKKVETKMKGADSIQKELDRMRLAKLHQEQFTANKDKCPEHYTELAGQSFKFWTEIDNRTYYVIGKFDDKVGRGPKATFTIQVEDGSMGMVLNCMAMAIVDYANDWRIKMVSIKAADKSQQYMVDALKVGGPLQAKVKMGNYKTPIECSIRSIYAGLCYSIFKRHYQGFKKKADTATGKAEEAIVSEATTKEVANAPS